MSFTLSFLSHKNNTKHSGMLMCFKEQFFKNISQDKCKKQICETKSLCKKSNVLNPTAYEGNV